MIVETGTGVTNADSYGAQATTTIFHAARGNAEWEAATSAARDASLIIATDYLEAHYAAVGTKLVATQGLQFPTVELGLPAVVVKAIMVLALDALSGPLTSRAERGIKALEKSKDGTGAIKTTYDDVAPSDPYPHITAMLAGVAVLKSAQTGASAWGGRIRK